MDDFFILRKLASTSMIAGYEEVWKWPLKFAKRPAVTL
jgi:hypothetical protein